MTALPLLILVAECLGHSFFVSGLLSIAPRGIVAGAGVGTFCLAPSLGLLNLLDLLDRRRPVALTVIDGGFALIARGHGWASDRLPSHEPQSPLAEVARD